MLTSEHIAAFSIAISDGPWKVCYSRLSGKITAWRITGQQYGSVYPLAVHEVSTDDPQFIRNAEVICDLVNRLPEIHAALVELEEYRKGIRK